MSEKGGGRAGSRIPLDWFSSDDFDRLSDGAQGVYWRLVVAAAANLSDGYLTAVIVRQQTVRYPLDELAAIIDELVGAEYATRRDREGLYLPQWQVHNLSGEKVRALSSANTEKAFDAVGAGRYGPRGRRSG